MFPKNSKLFRKRILLSDRCAALIEQLLLSSLFVNSVNCNPPEHKQCLTATDSRVMTNRLTIRMYFQFCLVQRISYSDRNHTCVSFVTTRCGNSCSFCISQNVNNRTRNRKHSQYAIWICRNSANFAAVVLHCKSLPQPNLTVS